MCVQSYQQSFSKYDYWQQLLNDSVIFSSNVALKSKIDDCFFSVHISLIYILYKHLFRKYFWFGIKFPSQRKIVNEIGSETTKLCFN